MRGNRLVILLSLVFMMSIVTTSVRATETYPDHEIRLIVGLAAGGSLDTMARSVQRFLPDVVKVSVLVENRQGALGKIALNYVMEQPPDGYTIFVFTQPGLTELLNRNPGLFQLDDFTYININWTDPLLISARKELGWKSVDDLIKAAKANPGKYTFAVPKGTAGDLASQMFVKRLGLDIRLVPYSGGGPKRASIMGAHTDITIGGAEGELALRDHVVPIAVFSEKPISSWPTAKPINESLAQHGYDVRFPKIEAYRFFCIRREFKEQYPDRWEYLVGAFKKLVLEHKGFQEFCDKAGIGREWHGPEESLELVKYSHEIFAAQAAPEK